MPQTRTAHPESLESPGSHEETRRVVLRLARLARQGKLGDVAAVVVADEKLDLETKRWVLDLATDAAFLHAAELYPERLRHRN